MLVCYFFLYIFAPSMSLSLVNLTTAKSCMAYGICVFQDLSSIGIEWEFLISRFDCRCFKPKWPRPDGPPDLPAWDAGNLIAKLAMKIALLYWCATSWPCQMRLVGASFTTIWSTYTVVEILILFSLYLGEIIEQKVRRQLSKFLVLSGKIVC